MTATEYVVLVDDEDKQTGIAEKLEAHQKNLLHRAFSVFIFRQQIEQLELLLQQRALHKYHSPGLWTNTCCSHPRPDEDIVNAGERRLREELGLNIALKKVGKFCYNAHFANGLSEHELDHVLIGEIAVDAEVKPNPEEVEDYRWISVTDLQQELQLHPDHFTPWLLPALEIALKGRSHGKL